MAKKKQEKDYAALSSDFMKIPRMDVRAARALLDLGFKESFELRGRDPETLLADVLKIRPKTPRDILGAIKLAVDFAERED